jgi:hypothetical protein
MSNNEITNKTNSNDEKEKEIEQECKVTATVYI